MPAGEVGEAFDGGVEIGDQRVDAGAQFEHQRAVDQVLSGGAPVHVARRLGIDLGRPPRSSASTTGVARLPARAALSPMRGEVVAFGLAGGADRLDRIRPGSPRPRPRRGPAPPRNRACAASGRDRRRPPASQRSSISGVSSGEGCKAIWSWTIRRNDHSLSRPRRHRRRPAATRSRAILRQKAFPGARTRSYTTRPWNGEIDDGNDDDRAKCSLRPRARRSGRSSTTPRCSRACVPGCEQLDKVSRQRIPGRRQHQGRAGQGALEGQGAAVRSRSAQRLQDLRRGRGRRRRLRQGRRHGGAHRQGWRDAADLQRRGADRRQAGPTRPAADQRRGQEDWPTTSSPISPRPCKADSWLQASNPAYRAISLDHVRMSGSELLLFKQAKWGKTISFGRFGMPVNSGGCQIRPSGPDYWRNAQ